VRFTNINSPPPLPAWSVFGALCLRLQRLSVACYVRGPEVTDRATAATGP